MTVSEGLREQIHAILNEALTIKGGVSCRPYIAGKAEAAERVAALSPPLPLEPSWLDELEKDALAAIADQQDDAAHTPADERPDLWDPPEVQVPAPTVLKLIQALRQQHEAEGEEGDYSVEPSPNGPIGSAQPQTQREGG